MTSAYNNRGTLYTRLGNFGLAINDFTLVISLSPEDVTAYHNRAVVHAAEGNYELAIADLEQALAIDADFAPSYAALGAVYSAIAAQQYQQFGELRGDNALLPAGTPIEVLQAVDEGMRTGDYSVWVALQTAAGAE